MNKTYVVYAVIAVGALAFITFVYFSFKFYKKRRKTHVKQLDTELYTKKWKALQKNCATRKTWPQAIVDADNLLDEALRQRKFKGKTTGERLVAAQHTLTENEDIWFSHKMRDSIVKEDVRRLKKQDILDALSGFRQALKDLGALEK
jgi:hypothetical protein